MKLCALSVDLDEVDNYRALHGLELRARGAHAVYRTALGRFVDFAAAERVPLSFFAIGRDLAREASAEALRAAWRAGHVVENHSFSHRYDLSRRPRAEIAADIAAAQTAISQLTGRQPQGFRAPGYTTSPALLDAVREAGLLFDASSLPSPPYQLAKLAALAALRVRRRRSAAIVGSPRSGWVPRQPRRLALPAYGSKREEGAATSALWELPMAVTRHLRLPVIGTSLTMAGPGGLGWLLAGCLDLPLISLELHGIDLLDPYDGLDDLLGPQPDVRLPLARKTASMHATVRLLRQAGYRFVTLAEAAAQLADAAG